MNVNNQKTINDYKKDSDSILRSVGEKYGATEEKNLNEEVFKKTLYERAPNGSSLSFYHLYFVNLKKLSQEKGYVINT